MGGSIVMVPVLHAMGHGFGLARATGLMVSLAGLGPGTVANILHKRVDFSLCAVMAVTSLAAAPAGAVLGSTVSDKVLDWVLTGYLVSVVVWMALFFPKNPTREPVRSRAVLGGIGMLSGLIAGFLGIGGGGVIIPMMVILGYDLKRVVAINAFVVSCSCMAGLTTFAMRGALYPEMSLPLAAISLVGGWTGIKIMERKLSQGAVRYCSMTIIVLLTLRQIFSMLF